MKKYITIYFIFLGLTTLGQEYKPIFLGKDGSTYKGLFLKFKEGTTGGTNFNFYSEPPQKFYQRPVYGNTEKYAFQTDTNKIKNREFQIVDVKPCSVCPNSKNDPQYFIFELNDMNETIYFLYDGESDLNFPFLVKGFNYTKEYLTRYIEKHIDDIDDKVTINSPLLNDISIHKVISNGKSTYYLSLESPGLTLNYGGRGVTVLFQDGTKWSKPNEEVEVKVVDGGGWGYTSFITLNDQDLLLFSKKVIKKFRLYIYDNNSPDEVDKFPFYVQSVIEHK